MDYKLIGSNDYTVDILQTIANNRGVESVRDITDVSEKDSLSPFLLDNMKTAVEELVSYMQADKRIHIIVDVDADGVTSGAILYKYLERSYNSNKVSWHMNSGKQHGIIMKELEGYTFDILVVPDAGSEDFLQHKTLNEMGKSVIILDHHLAKKQKTPAIIVNPQLDSYPNKMISGAGVTYKFCEAIDEIYSYSFRDGLEDLVAIGLIADMMDTREKDTRYLITKGLNEIKTPVVNSFIEAFDKVDKISISAISYYFAPLINAVIRLGTDKEKRKLFRAFIDNGTTVYSDVMGGFKRGVTTFPTATLKELREVKRMQDEIRDNLIVKCRDDIDSQKSNAVIYYIFNDYEYRSFSGLIAGQLADEYKKPTFIFFTDSDGVVSGSGRNYEKFSLKELKTYCDKLNKAKSIGGHESAFGISFNNINEAVSFFEDVNSELKDLSDSNYHTLDFIIKKDKISKEIINKISILNDYYGYKFEAPLILIKDIKLNIKDITVNKAFTMLKFNINNEVVGVRFKDVEELYDKMSELADFSIDIVGKVNINTFAGKTNYQFFIDDYELICYNDNKEGNDDAFWF